MLINLNVVVSYAVAAFGIYVAVKLYRHALRAPSATNILPPLGWLLAGLLSALHGFVAESGIMILVLLGVYWLFGVHWKNPSSS